MKLNNLNSKGPVIANPNDRGLYDKYLREIMKFKPLSREEEHELFVKYKETGDVCIREKLCKHNLLFVVSVAKYYSNMIPFSAITLEDLIGEGNYGILQAVDRFDYNSGNKFISYAVWWIRNGMVTCIQNNYKNIRIPTNVKDLIRKIEKEESKLQQLLGRDISTQELFESMSNKVVLTDKASSYLIDELFKINAFESSLNQVINSHTNLGGLEFIDTIVSEDNDPFDFLEEKDRVNLALELFDKVPQKIQNYFIDYFGLFGNKQLSLVEMGKKYDCSGTTIKNHINKYLRKLRGTHKSIGKHLFPTPDYEFNRQWKKRGYDTANTIFAI